MSSGLEDRFQTLHEIVRAARALGMATIKVDTPEQALRELAALLGFDLV